MRRNLDALRHRIVLLQDAYLITIGRPEGVEALIDGLFPGGTFAVEIRFCETFCDQLLFERQLLQGRAIGLRVQATRDHQCQLGALRQRLVTRKRDRYDDVVR